MGAVKLSVFQSKVPKTPFSFCQCGPDASEV
jgi:hypothetical protein